MKRREYEILADIFADTDQVTTDEINRLLDKAGIDYEKFRQKVLDKIADIRREIIYNESHRKIKHFKDLLVSLKDKLNIELNDEKLEKQLQLQFNKLQALTEEDIEDILKDEKKLKYLKEIIDSKSL